MNYQADLILAKYTCVALQRLNGSAKKIKGACFSLPISASLILQEGSLLDKTMRIGMDSPIFRKLLDSIVYPCRSRDWFAMAEQAINTVYALAERPDVLADKLIKELSRRAFSRQPKTVPVAWEQPKGSDAMDEDLSVNRTEEDASVSQNPSQQQDLSASQDASQQRGDATDTGGAFELSQLLFIVGHVAIKHIVYLELVEREWKRQKHEKELGTSFYSLGLRSIVEWISAESLALGNADDTGKRNKDGEELDQVAGNAEDEIGDRIALVREQELLYGPDSLLAVYGPLLVHICGSPHIFKVDLKLLAPHMTQLLL